MAETMTKEMFISVIKTSREALEEKIKDVRQALSDGSLTGYNKAKSILEEAVKTHNELLCKADYAKFAENENPIISAVEQFYIETLKVKEERDKNDGSITGINFEKKQSRIDLEKFCDFAGLDKTWSYDCDKLLALLTLRETDVFALCPSELSKKSFYFIAQAKKKKEGETPDSNTQIVRLLQKIIDGAIFVDNGDGLNTYKCTTHDLVFIHDAVTKMDTKEKCTISMLNNRQFKTVMMSVFAHCLGEAYKVKGAKTKSKEA